MRDEDDEREMTEFLLGGLGEADQERVLERLARDEVFFETMAAREDELILQWHRGELSPRQQQLFVRAYASPARRARVDTSLALLHAADLWKADEDTGLWAQIARWLTAPHRVPRVAFAGAAVVLAIAVSLGAFVVNQSIRRLRDAEQENAALRQQAAAGRRFTVAFNLTAVGERGPGVAHAMDRLRLPPDATEVLLTLDQPGAVGDGPFTADLEALDRRNATSLGPARVSRSATGSSLTFTVAPSHLPDGDYVLVVRRGGAEGSEIIARPTFRVTRGGA